MHCYWYLDQVQTKWLGSILMRILWLSVSRHTTEGGVVVGGCHAKWQTLLYFAVVHHVRLWTAEDPLQFVSIQVLAVHSVLFSYCGSPLCPFFLLWQSTLSFFLTMAVHSVLFSYCGSPLCPFFLTVAVHSVLFSYCGSPLCPFFLTVAVHSVLFSYCGSPLCPFFLLL